MLIRVLYKNGTFDMVKPQVLDFLIGQDKVTSFKRAESWAVVGRDPVRANRPGEAYRGPERRFI